jgi:hypothetical protein
MMCQAPRETQGVTKTEVHHGMVSQGADCLTQVTAVFPLNPCLFGDLSFCASSTGQASSGGSFLRIGAPAHVGWG